MTPLEQLIARLQEVQAMTDADRVVALNTTLDDCKRLLALERGRSVEAAKASGVSIVALAERAGRTRAALDKAVAGWRASQKGD